MHFETLAPIMPALMIALGISPIIAIAALISRDRLAARHRELKRTLNRVVGERDKAHFGLWQAAKIFDHYAQLHEEKNTDDGRAKAFANRAAAERCRDAAGKVQEP